MTGQVGLISTLNDLDDFNRSFVYFIIYHENKLITTIAHSYLQYNKAKLICWYTDTIPYTELIPLYTTCTLFIITYFKAYLSLKITKLLVLNIKHIL